MKYMCIKKEMIIDRIYTIKGELYDATTIDIRDSTFLIEGSFYDSRTKIKTLYGLWVKQDNFIKVREQDQDIELIELLYM